MEIGIVATEHVQELDCAYAPLVEAGFLCSLLHGAHDDFRHEKAYGVLAYGVAYAAKGDLHEIAGCVELGLWILNDVTIQNAQGLEVCHEGAGVPDKETAASPLARERVEYDRLLRVGSVVQDNYLIWNSHVGKNTQNKSYICVMELIFGTQNKGKLAEAQYICDVLGAKYGMEVKVLPMPEKVDIPEDGETYRENSLQKARWIWEHYGCSCFADDSGLEVEALGGEPGVHTARYCDRNFADGMDKLLARLEEVGAMEKEQRGASFVCGITLYLAEKDRGVLKDEGPYYFEGRCGGSISLSKCGGAGFGFDPVFMADETPGLCMAELSDEKKNSISHRAVALELMFKALSAK